MWLWFPGSEAAVPPALRQVNSGLVLAEQHGIGRSVSVWLFLEWKAPSSFWSQSEQQNRDRVSEELATVVQEM